MITTTLHRERNQCLGSTKDCNLVEHCRRKIARVFVIQNDCRFVSLVSIFKTITLVLDFFKTVK